MGRRKRYCLQVMKQFYLFKDETISESLSFSLKDLLCFYDEYVHTIVKIVETKEL